MRIFATLILVCASATIFAQRSTTKEVGDFDELKVFDLIEVRLIESNENKVVVKGKNTDDVRVINQNGTLKIRMQLEKSFHGDETFVEVYYKKVQVLDANEGAYIVANEPLEQNTLELRAQEGGRINLTVAVSHLKTKAVTGGSIEVVGTAGSQEVSLMTGGVFQGEDLQTKDTKVKITAAGEANVRASNFVDISITAGGDVYVYGNPTEIKKKRVAGGRIKVVD